MKKEIIIFIFCICYSCTVSSQTPTWLWTNTAGGANTDAGCGVTTDLNGNVFMTGYFSSPTITFGTTILTNTDTTGHYGELFIVKYDANGNVLWAKSAGGIYGNEGMSVTTDVNGNVILCGDFSNSTITFGTITLSNTSANTDIFIVKYDPNGNVLWAKSAGGNNSDFSICISIDTIGNVFMTGSFLSPNITFGTTTLTNVGTHDVYLVKYDPNGNVLWAKSGGGLDEDFANGLSTDVNGDVVITGSFYSQSITFGTTTLTNAGAVDIFIVKYDASGNLLWAKSEGGILHDEANSAVTDVNGNIIITGYFYSPTITFGTTTLTNVGYSDLFIVKYDASGNVIWAKGAGGSDVEYGNSIGTDASENVYIEGSFYSPTITFGTTTLTNAGVVDVFIVKYDAGGNVTWAKSAGGIGLDFATNITVDVSGKVIITGRYDSPTMTFGTTTLINASNDMDIFLAKIDASPLGVEEISEISDISIDPNPLTTQSTITFKEEQKNITIKIIDVLGNEIQDIKFSGKRYIIEKREMKTGVYFVQLIDEKNNVVNKKIVVQ